MYVAGILILILSAGGMAIPAEADDAVIHSDAYATVLRAEAFFHVLQEISSDIPEGSWVYGYPDVVPAGTVITTWYGSISLPGERGWMIFIDEEPMENWAHSCRYVFVNEWGDISMYDAYGPPENLEDWERIHLCTNPPVIEEEPDFGSLRCLGMGDQVIYWQIRSIDDVIVEGDYILSVLTEGTEFGMFRQEHIRTDLPDRLVPGISQEEAESMVTGRVVSSECYILAPDSSRVSIRPVPSNPCWAVRSTDGTRLTTTLIDGTNGIVIEKRTSCSMDVSGEMPETGSTAVSVLPAGGNQTGTHMPTDKEPVPGFGIHALLAVSLISILIRWKMA